MKRNIKSNILGWMTAAVSLLTASCVDSMSEAGLEGEYTTVTFTIAPETANGLATRADADGLGPDAEDGKVTYPTEGALPHISDGSKADVLIYAVYDENGELLMDYADGGNTDELKNAGETDWGNIEKGDGQTITKINQFPVRITFKMRRGKTYKVAFWAQNSDCQAYDTKNLKQVKVHYAEIDAEADGTSTPNNDEMRDAFCKVENIKLESKADENRTIYLYRPLAQINVGTTGYDYETIVQDPKAQYAYTRVQIHTACRYLNVVEDKIVTDDNTENRSALEYTYARIPAYINYGDEEWANVNLAKADADKEEFLKVHLKTDEDADKYLADDNNDGFSDYADLSNDGEKTETFKYLSMCYVLVPSETSEDGTYSRTALENVKVWIATDADGKDEVQIVDLVNVPVQRNYRTNIVGDIMTTKTDLTVTLDPMYAGDYNGFYQNGKAAWSGPLADGAYYDAEADEILISNANGLLWLQRMVNGMLVYRDRNNDIPEKVTGKTALTYYTLTDSGAEQTDTVVYNIISDPTIGNNSEEAKRLKARILRATHQDTNQAYNQENRNKDHWPNNKNFHFVGRTADNKPDPAKVKLVADIDLSGIDWIPIGFDAKIGDTYELFQESFSTVRAFCGVFDGNGHTISNLKTQRFSAKVHDLALQKGSAGPYDNVQWFPMGLFGQIAENAVVKNLTLRNVDIYGYHCAGAVCGIATGAGVTITDCTVDGGSLVLTPMYRGDIYREKNNPEGYSKTRTFARGVYLGGIVGHYNGTGSVTGCNVKNVLIHGYRTVGGVIGAISKATETATLDKDTWNPVTITTNENYIPQHVSNNTIQNSVILADRFKPFSQCFHYKGTDCKQNVDWTYGYGWDAGYGSYGALYVGGEESYDNPSYYANGNNAIDTYLAEFSTYYSNKETKTGHRVATVGNLPLQYFPMLSSWFCDEFTLTSSLNGKPSAYKHYNTHPFWFLSSHQDITFLSPYKMPYDLTVDWDTESGKVGMYVDLATLANKNASGAVEPHTLTVNDVKGENDCAMYITSCDRTQFTGNGDNKWYTSATVTVENMLVRGNPYAYTGICLAPTKCLSKIELKNVSVYDCYQTLAIDGNMPNESSKQWPQKSTTKNTTLSVSNSNLRGYTVPGADWNKVEYSNVVFERGAHIQTDSSKLPNEYTCEVAATTTFTDCTFKAPFIINITNDGSATFNNCKATYAGKTTDIDCPAGTKKITIDGTGNVTYGK